MYDHLWIYLDESGDLGFNFEKKRTPQYFIITLLACNKNAMVEIKNAVKRTLKNKLQSKKKELKGTSTILSVKKYFYNLAKKSPDWQLYSIVLDKQKLKNKFKRLPAEHRIYNYLASEILRHVNLSIVRKQLVLIVDKRKGKQGINDFNKYLSNHLEAMLPLNVMYDITHQQSHDNPILQAVDLFCWGIRQHYECKNDDWLTIYSERLMIVETDNLEV